MFLKTVQSGGGSVRNFKVEKITNLSPTGANIQVDFVPHFILLECKIPNAYGWHIYENWYQHNGKTFGYWNGTSSGDELVSFTPNGNGGGTVTVKSYGSNWNTNTSTVYIVGEQ